MPITGPSKSRANSPETSSHPRQLQVEVIGSFALEPAAVPMVPSAHHVIGHLGRLVSWGESSWRQCVKEVPGFQANALHPTPSQGNNAVPADTASLEVPAENVCSRAKSRAAPSCCNTSSSPLSGGAHQLVLFDTHQLFSKSIACCSAALPSAPPSSSYF